VYGFQCEYCTGTVREQHMPREVFNHARGIVILENVPVGECDHCHAHYYSAVVLKRVESIINGTAPCSHIEQVPVAPF
jgi:YgiT-type zinc finger domain-containing protein